MILNTKKASVFYGPKSFCIKIEGGDTSFTAGDMRKFYSISVGERLGAPEKKDNHYFCGRFVNRPYGEGKIFVV